MVGYSNYENGGCYGSLYSREKGEDESRERESAQIVIKVAAIK